MKGVHKRSLGGFLGSIRRSENPDECIVQTILVTDHQNAKGFRVTLQAGVNDLDVGIVHGLYG